MAHFELEGYHKKTMRLRKRTVKADNAEQAIAVASKDEGLIVDTATVKRVYPIEHFFCRVAGVSHNNPDGTSRQKVIRRCRVGQVMGLVKDPKNRYSRHAIAVVTQDRQQVGFLPDEVAAQVAHAEGERLAFVVGTGEPEGSGILGMALLAFAIADPETPLMELYTYVQVHEDELAAAQCVQAIKQFIQVQESKG